MKRILILITLMACYGPLSAQQGFKLGVQGSLPVNSETNNTVSLAVGVNAGYMFALGEVVDFGPMVGFINGFPEKFDNGGIDLPHVQFAPLAASVRIWPSNSVTFGLDGGYALGLNDGNDGGFYYKPILGFLFGPQTELSISYTGIETDTASWATVNFGILYTFPENRFH